jgi:hypothetical protein
MNDGTWKPGDMVAPNGWSSMQYETLAECEKRKKFMNEGFNKSDWKGKIKGECQELDPKVFYLESRLSI